MRRVIGFLLLCCLAVALPRFAHADDAVPCNDAILKSLGDYIGAAHFVRPTQDGRVSGLVVQDTCKVWPGDPGITLAVVAYTDHPVKVDDIDSWEEVVAMVDTHTAKIVAAIKGGGGQIDAATALGGYTLDTAPYQLAPDVRAFGVISHNDKPGPNCADGGSYSELTLWVRDKNQLRSVFSAPLDEWTTIEGSPCATSEPGRIDDARMTIAIEKTQTQGFADLSLIAHVTPNIWAADGTHRQGALRINRVVFKYDGKSYGFGPSAFWWSSEK